MEKTKVEVVPEMRTVINNLNAVVNQITQSLQAVRQEIKQLEVAYEHIMKQAKQNKGGEDIQLGQQKSGGVLV